MGWTDKDWDNDYDNEGADAQLIVSIFIPIIVQLNTETKVRIMVKMRGDEVSVFKKDTP